MFVVRNVATLLAKLLTLNASTFERDVQNNEEASLILSMCRSAKRFVSSYKGRDDKSLASYPLVALVGRSVPFIAKGRVPSSVKSSNTTAKASVRRPKHVSLCNSDNSFYVLL